MGDGVPEISKIEYEERFWQSFGTHLPDNVIGYGPDRPWIAPLKNPNTLLAKIDRHILTSETGGPMIYLLMHTGW